MANMHRGKNYVPTLERGNDKKIQKFSAGKPAPTKAVNSVLCRIDGR